MIDSDKKNFDNLIQKLKNGDESAFTEIYERCHKHVEFLCSKFFNNKEDVEEVVQDTFVTLFKTIKSNNNELISDTFMGYLRKIATSRCYDKHKLNARKVEFTTDIDLEEQSESYLEVDKDFLPEMYLQDKEMRAELLKIIEKLPKNQREMIYLYYYVDLNTEEIAKLLDCRAGNVRQSLYMARQTIKNKLEGIDNKGKKKALKGMALIPLADVLLLEEQAFVAGFADIAGAGTLSAGIAAKLNTVSKISKTYIAAACAVIVCVACVTLYFALQQEAYEQDIAAASSGTTDNENYEYGLQTSDVHSEDELQALDINGEYESQTSNANGEYESQTQDNNGGNTTQTSDISDENELQTSEDTQEIEPPTFAQENQDGMDNIDNVETNYNENQTDESEPISIDRTAEILTALSVANTSGDVERIISSFGFRFYRQISGAIEQRYRFYVTNEGSGDILIGIAMHEDGTGWRMQFEHYRDGQAPTSASDLLRWIE